MGELREQQTALDIDAQVENLKSIGLIIKDEDYAKRILNDISYFRLIKAFSLGLKAKNSQYNVGITFENVVQLYLFNSNLRQHIFPQIEIIEINLRCRLANYFCTKYGVIGYQQPENFANPDYHESFINDINIEIDRNVKAPFVKNFKENYINGDIPLYALVEMFSFGTMSKFYKNMKNEDKKAVAKSLMLAIHILKVGLRV